MTCYIISQIFNRAIEKIKNNKDELFKERDKIKQSLDEKTYYI